MGNLGLIPGLGRSSGGGHSNPFQYSCLENPHGQRSLVGYSPRGRKESDTTEQLSIAQCAFHKLGRGPRTWEDDHPTSRGRHRVELRV